jgi:glycosyltransferase involved in cell wall biosynthesis
LRYIEDDELNYLFSKCQYVLLPYTEIYQSGVLEVVIYFQCPALMSDIPFFHHTLSEFPSFGHLFTPNTPEALADRIQTIAHGEGRLKAYFTEEDQKKYKDLHDPSRLISFLLVSQ